MIICLISIKEISYWFKDYIDVLINKRQNNHQTR